MARGYGHAAKPLTRPKTPKQNKSATEEVAKKKKSRAGRGWGLALETK
jgi:ribosomal protein L13E